MGGELEHRLVSSLRAEVGDVLRFVAEYDREGYDVVYSRGAVEKRVRKHADDVHTELVLQGNGHEHLEDPFHAGDLHCSMHRFDDLTAFNFAQAAYSGVFVNIESDAHVDLSGFSNTVKHYLD